MPSSVGIANAPASSPAGAPLRLSARQSLMWLDEQLYPDARYHNSVLRIAFDGRVDAGRLARSWEETVAGRDALRMVVDRKEPRQWCRQPSEIELPELSFDDPAQLSSWIAGRSTRLFAADGFRWDAALLHAGPEHDVLYVCLHHMITDGISMMLLAEDLSERYSGRTPKPSSSFVEFLEAEERYRGSPKARRDREYWSQKLQVETPPLSLYGLTRADRSASLERVSHDGGEQRARRLAALAQNEPFVGMSPALSRLVLIATGVVALIHRAAGNNEVLLAIPFANRAHQFRRTCGLLMEQLVLRIQIEEGDTFASLAGQVRQELTDAIRHGQSCISDRGFDTVTLNLLPRPPKQFAGLAATVRLDPAVVLGGPSGDGDLRNSLGIRVLDFDEGPLEVDFDFHRATFDEGARKRIPSHFFAMLDALAADPNARIDSVDFLGEEERRTVLRAASEAEPGGPRRDVVELIASQAARRPAHPAVSGPDASLTYAELEARSNQLSRRLRALGVRPESRVAIALTRGTGELVALLATLKAGGAYVPLDQFHPVERVRMILTDSAPDVLVVQKGSPLASAAPPGTAVLIFDDLASATEGYQPTPLGESVASDQLAYILFTSGSTGRPKGVEVPRGALANFLGSMARQPGMSESDRLLAVTTTTFDIAGLELFLPLTVGATVVIADRDSMVDPRSLRKLLETQPFTVMQATPALWRLLLDAGWRGDGKLRIFCGGEALSVELARKLLACGAELWNLYGPTETTIWSALERVGTNADRITIGRPIDRTQLYLLDGARRPVPIGTIGELYIGGAGLARGYHGRPDLTADRFLPDPFGQPGERIYRTGDLGRLLADGRFECLGRVDHQVKIRGFRVELGEIESILRSVPGVREAVVVADFHDSANPRLLAYWVGEADGNALFALTRARLPQYMVPSAFVQMASFPLTTSGKVDRKSLPAPAAAAQAAQVVRWPRNDTETRLAAIWSEVLNVSSIGIDQDFFSLGGTSLQVIEARTRIEAEFGVELPLRILFETPTLEAIAGQMGKPAATDEPIVVHLRRGRPDLPPLFCLFGVQLYWDLAMALEGDRSVIGMHVPVRRPPGEKVYPGIPEIARRYLELIRRVQPSGPYHLAGLCFGGITAFEVGRQLEALGEQVALVAIFEAYLPRGIQVDRLRRLRHYLGMAAREPAAMATLVRSKARQLRERYRQESIHAEADANEDLPIDGPEVDEELRRYQGVVGKLNSRLLVFRSSSRVWPEWVRISEHLGWDQLAGRVSLHQVASDHLGLMRGPHAGILARAINEALAEKPASGA